MRLDVADAATLWKRHCDHGSTDARAAGDGASVTPMKCLIVAAGQGIRLREKGGLKPLVPLKGISLIEHVILRARRAGIDEFLVVVGYRMEDLRTELEMISARHDVRITPIVNPDWKRANGVSLFAAKPYLQEPFLLTMCDHLTDPAIYRSLIDASFDPDTVTLAVDYNTGSPLNDPDDVTRVRCSEGRIEQIGKLLPDYNAIDTGTFLCGPIIFRALEESQARGDDSISGAMTTLAAWRKAHVLDVDGKLWVDVDDPVAFGKAEHLLDMGRL